MFNAEQVVSVLEANQNFGEVIKKVEQSGLVYIFENDKPRYKIVDLTNEAEIEMTDDEKIDFVAKKILRKYHKAFEELAK